MTVAGMTATADRRDNAIPVPFFIVLVFWLMAIFASFGLFAEVKAIVIASVPFATPTTSFKTFDDVLARWL